MADVAKGCHLSVPVRSIRMPYPLAGLWEAGISPRRAPSPHAPAKETQKHFKYTFSSSAARALSQSEHTYRRSVRKQASLNLVDPC
jgi:hypothetical protein